MNSLQFFRAGRSVCLLMVVFTYCGCDSDDPVTGPADPHAPYRPELVAPESNAQNQPVIPVELVGKPLDVGAGTDEAHLSEEDVDQLRQLVQSSHAKETTYPSDARITVTVR